MSIQEILLHATNRPPMAFQGRIAAQAIGPTDDPRLLGRHHAITVYETDLGELHLVFEFMSECEHEKPRCDVELGIQSDEIPEVLLAYDATEYLDRTRLSNRYEREITQFMKRLRNQHDDLCASIERQMLNYQPQVPVSGQHDGGDVDVDSSGWKSWLPFGKPR